MFERVTMTNKFGPSRGELWFRLVAGLVGLALMIAAVTARGMPSGPALVEVVGFGGVFFGGTVLWSVWKLWKGRAD
jgi:hypothetical protein